MSGGLWYDTGMNYTLDQSKVFAGDFNRDGYTDLGLVTPRGATGLNFVPLLSNGSSFTSGGLWYDTGSSYSLDQSKIIGSFAGGQPIVDRGLAVVAAGIERRKRRIIRSGRLASRSNGRAERWRDRS